MIVSVAFAICNEEVTYVYYGWADSDALSHQLLELHCQKLFHAVSFSDNGDSA